MELHTEYSPLIAYVTLRGPVFTCRTVSADLCNLPCSRSLWTDMSNLIPGCLKENPTRRTSCTRDFVAHL